MNIYLLESGHIGNCFYEIYDRELGELTNCGKESTMSLGKVNKSRRAYLCEEHAHYIRAIKNALYVTIDGHEFLSYVEAVEHQKEAEAKLERGKK